MSRCLLRVSGLCLNMMGRLLDMVLGRHVKI